MITLAYVTCNVLGFIIILKRLFYLFNLIILQKDNLMPKFYSKQIHEFYSIVFSSIDIFIIRLKLGLIFFLLFGYPGLVI